MPKITWYISLKKKLTESILLLPNGLMKHIFIKKLLWKMKHCMKPLIYTEKVAKFSLGDFTEMFAYQGLQIQEVFGDYDFGNYDVKKSQRMVMIAKKINT